MAISPRHVDALIDIVENKLSDMLVWDSDDRKEVVALRHCLEELQKCRSVAGDIIAFDGPVRRRHRAGTSAA